ncbi:MAG: T9SS type A sorting domain-containing protein [Candidatus Kapaibacterium sp.]
MKKSYALLILACIYMVISVVCKANTITANPGNYKTFLTQLVASDTLLLVAGTYTNNLTLKNINGTATQPIVITGSGNATVFQGQSCCNTISITQCSYLVIRNLKLDGMHEFVDAVKAEGTTANWAHHITLEQLNIVNYDADQQSVGISTKCSTWDWIIRKNIIIKAGTGMYLGNSDGTKPFVNGLIENNFIANTIGYNIEIKHQLDGVRNEFAGTAVNGKTIIRHNVFTKDTSSSTGGSARPNLLVGGFPLKGWGAQDSYEICGNFFYNNPVEALFQGTGNIMLYQNIFVNHFNTSGFRAVYITPQNGVSPQNVQVFHNTVWTANSSGGIRLYNPNTSFKQYCYANVVCSASPITNFTDTLNNITDSYSNAGNYFLSATADINTLNLYPQNGKLKGSVTQSTVFQNNSNWNKDFNGDVSDWTYRGAYSGCCVNNGWKLQLDTMPTHSTTTTMVEQPIHNYEYMISPNPATEYVYISVPQNQTTNIKIMNTLGMLIREITVTHPVQVNVSAFASGMYVVILNNSLHQTQLFIKQ